MSDIFLSCATDDGVAAKKLAAVFRGQGWTVWWDASTITPGANYLEAVMEELEHSKVCVVLWSRAARESRLVHEALERMGPAPPIFVLLDKIEPPLPFTLLRVFDLSNWDGVDSHAELQKLLRQLHALIATSSPTAEQREARDAPPLIGSTIRLRKSGELIMPSQATQNSATVRADSRPEGEARFSGVFISYRRNEAAAYAGRLYDRLAARFGKERIFIDTENVGWGEDFVEAITAAAESCAVMIALVSREWSRGAGGQSDLDDYVRLEVATALGRKIRVIPILIQGASMPAPKELPEDLAPLARRNALALSDNRWERDVEDLIKNLEKILNG